MLFTQRNHIRQAFLHAEDIAVNAVDNRGQLISRFVIYQASHRLRIVCYRQAINGNIDPITVSRYKFLAFDPPFQDCSIVVGVANNGIERGIVSANNAVGEENIQADAILQG